MLRKLAIAASLAFLAWWASGVDGGAVKHQILAMRDAGARFGSDRGGGDWGGP